MEEILSKRVIGQKQAIVAISNAIRRSRAGISEENRPLGSFIFLGPTGVGKTETAKALAEFLFNDENALVRLDMSEYMERHTVSKIIGSPPGYVGYEEGGQLTEKIRRRPYSVILLDEIEKAHPEVFNIGSEYIAKMSPVGFLAGDKKISQEDLKEKVKEALKEQFRPELLNRIDEIIIFNYLGKQEIQKIVDLELGKVIKRLQGRKINLEVKKPARELLAEKGFDPNFGARPLKRVIQKLVLDPLALKIVKGEVQEGEKVIVDAKEGEILIRVPQEILKTKRISKREKIGVSL